jgi:hypothetical protein
MTEQGKLTEMKFWGPFFCQSSSLDAERQLIFGSSFLQMRHITGVLFNGHLAQVTKTDGRLKNARYGQTEGNYG